MSAHSFISILPPALHEYHLVVIYMKTHFVKEAEENIGTILFWSFFLFFNRILNFLLKKLESGGEEK